MKESLIKKSIIGLWSSNLYTGAVYTELYTDCMFSAMDKNIDAIMTFLVKPTIEMMEGSKAIKVSTKIYMSWIEEPHSFRRRDEEFNTNSLSKGRAIVIKSSGTSINSIPQPVPIERLTFDLEFDFPKRKPILHIGESSQVEYKLNTKQGLHIKLKKPHLERIGLSRDEQQHKFTKNLEDSDSD